MSITLDAEDAETLREVMEARHSNLPGQAAWWLLKVELRRARRMGADAFVNSRSEEAWADHEAMKAAGEPALPAIPAGVISLDQWKSRTEGRRHS